MNDNKSAQHDQKRRPPKRKKEKSLDNVSSGCKCPTRYSSRLLRKKSCGVNDDAATDHDDHTVNDEVIKVFEKEPNPTFEILPIVQCSVASSSNNNSSNKNDISLNYYRMELNNINNFLRRCLKLDQFLNLLQV